MGRGSEENDWRWEEGVKRMISGEKRGEENDLRVGIEGGKGKERTLRDGKRY